MSVAEGTPVQDTSAWTPVEGTPVQDTSAWTPVEVPTGKDFEAKNKLSPEDRQNNEFLLGVSSGASGLEETETPIKDTLKSLFTQPLSAREAFLQTLGPGGALARGIWGIGKELFSPQQPGESEEDTAARRSHAVGKAVGAILPMMIGEERPNVKASLPESLGSKLRDPVTNEIKPGVQVAVRLGGTAAGHAAGIPGAGELGGYLLSKDIADWMIPDHPEYIKNQLFESKAQDLMRRGREQAALDRQAATAARQAEKNMPPSNLFQGMTSTVPEEVQTMPVRSLPNTPAGSATALPQAGDVRTTPFPAKFVSQFEKQPPAEELSPAAQDLISRTQRLVQPGEMPTAADLKRAGDLTQVPTLRLRALAKFGDKLAQNELNRRMKQEGALP